MPELDLPGVTASVSGAGNGSAKFDLEFLLRSDDRRGLHGAVLYAADLFDADTVRRMGAVLGRVLEQVLADPGRPLSALEVLDPEERELLTGSWAGVKVPGARRPPTRASATSSPPRPWPGGSRAPGPSPTPPACRPTAQRTTWRSASDPTTRHASCSPPGPQAGRRGSSPRTGIWCRR
ncbi:condensation domain-containing protein [Streptomyces wedmorensis]|uniref:condensation domain-containing protein n=1 Tax=Streptomyces wedmorensis TaxID=43759 RepID=UPI00068FD730|nr:condensation domain-containing protein [Streptomyces wedmorensis]